ncbi:gamma-glutamyl-gamma-aminobutyrate hydrolase family protein [Kangiella koreensis]|uniref:Peptidase C26 n=1 Tax=Kangiella koreensis (strain DSM 16069 / JCM 12317 / KCTC 12182 / SW-125) TaxID=523791 RepID=C7R5P7_KANKD|nr:type 1 glutamine amidotransferase [Kangiella koreensis]ACV27221.1 peptidase C26 [Kangiella koreensis DSM 16069]
MAKPVIAITGPNKGAFGPRLLVAWAVRFYGGRPLQLRPGDEQAQHEYDGVVITGGHDVEPVLYATEPEVEPKYDSARDAFEMKIIKDALKRNLPLLGICRGAQLLNVACGGTLFQQLHLHRKKTSNRWTIFPLKTLYKADTEEASDSLLLSITGSDPSKINSLHNQGIDKIGDNLIVTGRDADDIVQAIEAPAIPFVLGVQWHPEFLIYMKSQRAFFKAVVKNAVNN